MEDPRQHLMKIIGTLTVENIEFSTALMNRTAELKSAQERIKELEKQAVNYKVQEFDDLSPAE